MKIKINNKFYDHVPIPQYKFLETKLKAILSDNRQLPKFKFYGIRINGYGGILVCGTDSLGVRPFQKFYSINDINYYFNKIAKKIMMRRTPVY